MFSKREIGQLTGTEYILGSQHCIFFVSVLLYGEIISVYLKKRKVVEIEARVRRRVPRGSAYCDVTEDQNKNLSRSARNWHTKNSNDYFI